MFSYTKQIAFTNFFDAIHFFLTTFVVAPYLAQFVSNEEVGLIFALGAGVALLAFILLPYALQKVPLKTVAIALSIAQFFVLALLAISPPAPALFVLIILLLAVPALIAYTFDIFLESATTDESSTGNIRGFFITLNNVALVLSPLAIGFLLGDGNQYEKVFAFAAGSLLPFIFLTTVLIHGSPRKLIKKLSLINTLRCLTHSKDVVLGALAHFVMLLFFSWVVIYIPLYLHSELGIPWNDLGPAFALMLLPYVLLELPVGILADKYFGERELMMIGFAIMGVSFALIAFITTPFVTLFLVLVLIATRVGGALAEITTETYFFKHVDGSDISSISLFRMIRPLGALAGPLIGSTVLIFTSLQGSFLILGGLCLLGIPLAFFLRDTR